MADKLIEIVGEWLRNYTGLEEKMQNLERRINLLTVRAADVIAATRDSELHSGRKRKMEVEEWLRLVEEKKAEFEVLKEESLRAGFFSRINLVKRADSMLQEIADLEQQSAAFGELLIDLHESKQVPLIASECTGRVFKQNLRDIRVWLMDDKISGIGIYGMAGVGKTTLAMSVYNNVLGDTKFFGPVYWITVSEGSTIPKLQKDIGERFNLDLSSVGDEKIRAALLCQALKRNGKFVIILDDVWAHFEVEKVGIPLGIPGVKLIVTSRSLDVCSRIGCQKEIKVETLCQEEAWKLFVKKLGYCSELPLDVQAIARSMVRRCTGLPLAIISVAGSMKGVNDINEWRDALEELEENRVGHDDEVIQILQYSFNRLRDQRLKDCFLYCSLYPEDYRIRRDELIRQFIVEGLMDKRGRRQAEFDQGHTILNRLENVCLLEPASEIFETKCVKMHDLNREMALKITQTDPPKYMVKSGIGLREIPEDSEWTEDLEKVSLMNNQISFIPLGTSPKCPKLSTLILAGNPLTSIPDSFFAELGGLRVLNLSRSYLEELPNCISDMEDLTTLLLGGCPRLKFVPHLGKLTALKELDLRETGVSSLPEGLERLVNLKCLDMFSTRLEIIAEGILPKLCNLQSLKIPVTIEVHVKELETLTKLEEFQGGFSSIDDFIQFARTFQSYDRPCSYNIQIGLRQVFHRILRGTMNKRVILRGIGLNRTISLPGDLQQLELVQCHGLAKSLADVFSQLNIRGQGLLACEITSCEEIECILKVTSSVESQNSCMVPLRSIKHLLLDDLPSFSGLVQGVSAADLTSPIGIFSCLKSLRICGCKELRKLFTPRLLQHLPKLQVLQIHNCDGLEEVIGEHSDELHLTPINHINFLKIKVLHLEQLPGLKSIFTGTMSCDSIEMIYIDDCPGLRRLPFLLPTINENLLPPPALKWINLPKGEWWNSLQWDDTLMKSVHQPFVRFFKWLE